MSKHSQPARLLMNQGDFSEMRSEPLDASPGAGPDEVVFQISRFALTFNNVTYATFGDALRYWRFFPVEHKGWGQLPVWGYADVVESNVADIAADQRYYGYWPAATHVTLKPGKVGVHSFRDDAAHRADLPEIYNWYQRTDDDPLHNARTEPLHAIYRPLFITAFCLADFLSENNFFGAKRVAVSSASSKTAYATAFCIRQHSSIAMAGLTSARNRDFVERLELYNTAIAYDDFRALDADTATLYIDFAGNTKLQAEMHRFFGSNLVYDCSVGSAQSLVPPKPERNLPGPKPEFFFAPKWIAKRHKDWGTGEFNRRSGQACKSFFDYVTDNELIELAEQRGLEATQHVLVEMLRGRTDPAVGHVIDL